MAKELKTKDKVLQILRDSGSRFISGQEIADQIYVTRASVWKAIKALEKEGLEIEAVTNKGYRLLVVDDYINKNEIMEYLQSDHNMSGKIWSNMHVHDVIESTNEEAKRLGKTDNKDAIVIAGSQTNGKGRRGRVFYSPSRTGIYISFLIHPDIMVSKASWLTCMMAVAVCEAIENVTGISSQIKWVNDIFVNDKKVAGILTEVEGSVEDGYLEYAVIGVGINLYSPYDGFPSDIVKEAGSVLNGALDSKIKSRLYAAIIAQFSRYYFSDKAQSFIDGYRDRSMLIGHYVKLRTPDHEVQKNDKGYALAIGIDDECRLLVKYEDGTSKALSYGEVSAIKY